MSIPGKSGTASHRLLIDPCVRFHESRMRKRCASTGAASARQTCLQRRIFSACKTTKNKNKTHVTHPLVVASCLHRTQNYQVRSRSTYCFSSGNTHTSYTTHSARSITLKKERKCHLLFTLRRARIRTRPRGRKSRHGIRGKRREVGKQRAPEMQHQRENCRLEVTNQGHFSEMFPRASGNYANPEVRCGVG